jgi:hypothetical protein
MKPRANLFLIIIAGVLGLVLVLSGFLLFRGIHQFGQAEAKLDRSVNSLRNYYARNPFPSAENVEIEEQNIHVLKDWFEKMVVALRDGEVAPQQRTPSTFNTLLSNKKIELTQLARKNATALPEGFAFGFERYSSGVLPSPADVPRLTQQLTIAENICRIIFEEKARELISLNRDEFEDVSVAGGAGAEGDRRMPRLRAGSAAAEPEMGLPPSPQVVRDAGLLKPGALHAKMRFRVVFKAGERELFNSLNRLAKHGMFAVVSALDLKKEGEDVLVPGAKKAGETGVVDAEAAATTATKEKEKAPVRRRDRMVSGPLLEQPMDVTLDLDVYRFAGGGPNTGV